MTPLLFRGKRQDNDEWITESGIIYDEEITPQVGILDVMCGEFEDVRSMTASQFTGLKDCKGKEIFENDVVRIGSLTGVVMWHPYMTCFFINADGKQPTINYTCATLGEMWKSYRNEITVIGDVFQPEFADGKWKEL